MMRFILHLPKQKCAPFHAGINTRQVAPIQFADARVPYTAPDVARAAVESTTFGMGLIDTFRSDKPQQGEFSFQICLHRHRMDTRTAQPVAKSARPHSVGRLRTSSLASSVTPSDSGMANDSTSAAAAASFCGHSTPLFAHVSAPVFALVSPIPRHQLPTRAALGARRHEPALEHARDRALEPPRCQPRYPGWRPPLPGALFRPAQVPSVNVFRS